VARSTFHVHTAGIMKLEKALRMLGSTHDFRAVIDGLAEAARTLKNDHVPRAYIDPYSLIHTIAREPLRLVAGLQYEGGARIREVALIKDVQASGGSERPTDRGCHG